MTAPAPTAHDLVPVLQNLQDRGLITYFVHTDPTGELVGAQWIIGTSGRPPSHPRPAPHSHYEVNDAGQLVLMSDDRTWYWTGAAWKGITPR